MKKHLSCLAVCLLATIVTGCASNAPSASYRKQITDTTRICPTDEATVQVSAAPGVEVKADILERLSGLIKKSIDTKKNAAKCPEIAKRTFTLDTKITQYEPGSKFARFMLAGLGQIHIDGDSILRANSSEVVADFTIEKTFAFGGIYGASTGIEEVEPAFAEGVANAVVKQ